MYKVLIVDDEPIILSGIKHMIDWRKADLEVVGAARDGNTALSMIETLLPDIVITDINMPNLSGIELLKKARLILPSAVFIMLTCLEEFALAQEALKYKAVDYILKTDLEEEVLLESLERAKVECRNRKSLATASLKNEVDSLSEKHVLDALLSKIYLAEPYDLDQMSFFEKAGMDRNICLLQVMINPIIDVELRFNPLKMREQIDYSYSIIQNIVSSCFVDNVLIEKSKSRFFSYYFFLYNVDERELDSKMHVLDGRIRTNLGNIIGAESGIIYSSVVDSIQQLEICKKDITELKDIYFLTGESATPADVGRIQFSDGSLETARHSCIASIAKRNSKDLALALDLLNQKIASENFRYAHTIWSSEAIISASLKDSSEDQILLNLKDSLSYISNHKLLKLWYFALKKHLTDLWTDKSMGKYSIIDKTKAYIDANINKRLYLSDIADYLGITSSYLSATFSRECNMSVVEYINSRKTEEAMNMISTGEYKIHEICTALGFDNSYYFSKIFKKYAHMSPSEYQELMNRK